MAIRSALIAVAAILFASAASAAPDGADWDHHGGRDAQDCTACHFDSRAQADSARLTLEGIPARLRPDEIYHLTLKLNDPALITAGFLIRAAREENDAGHFEPADDRTEANGARLRTTLEGSRQVQAGAAEWKFLWRAPDDLDGPVTFNIAANAANDDMSPFGDTIYLTKIVRGVWE